MFYCCFLILKSLRKVVAKFQESFVLDYYSFILNFISYFFALTCVFRKGNKNMKTFVRFFRYYSFIWKGLREKIEISDSVLCSLEVSASNESNFYIVIESGIQPDPSLFKCRCFDDV
jgi:hypothetical protein